MVGEESWLSLVGQWRRFSRLQTDWDRGGGHVKEDIPLVLVWDVWRSHTAGRVSYCSIDCVSVCYPSEVFQQQNKTVVSASGWIVSSLSRSWNLSSNSFPHIKSNLQVISNDEWQVYKDKIVNKLKIIKTEVSKDRSTQFLRHSRHDRVKPQSKDRFKSTRICRVSS